MRSSALSANTSDNPFRIAILPWTPSRRQNLLNAHSINSCREIMTIDSITISHQVARRGIVGERFHHLLCRPSSRRVFRDIEMQNSATVMSENDEDIEHAELYGWNCKEVDRDHLADVISKKRQPGLRWLSRLLRHQARHRPFGNLESQLFQFPVYPWRSPGWIRLCHCLDEFPYLRTGSRSTKLFRLG